MIDKPRDAEIMGKLQAPFKESEYEWRVQSESKAGDKVCVLCYVQARAIMNRLDDTVGPFGWSVEYAKGPEGGVVCRLSVKSPEGEWVTKEDAAPNTDIEAVKGGISAALKRAGNVWGVGRVLYNLESHWVNLTASRGGHYHKGKFWDEPKLPDWAVSERCLTPAPQPEPAAPPVPKDKPEPNMSNFKVAWPTWKERNKVSTVKSAVAVLALKYTVTAEAKAFITKMIEGAQ